jgi:hypothetical protein
MVSFFMRNFILHILGVNSFSAINRNWWIGFEVVFLSPIESFNLNSFHIIVHLHFSSFENSAKYKFDNNLYFTFRKWKKSENSERSLLKGGGIIFCKQTDQSHSALHVLIRIGHRFCWSVVNEWWKCWAEGYISYVWRESSTHTHW